MRNSRIRYSIFPSNPEAHLFEVRCTVDNPEPTGQKFSLPTWIPGSYLIREFAKHVVRIRAQNGRKLLRMVKLDKNTWQVEPFDGPVTVTACSTDGGTCDQYAKCNVRDPLWRVRERILTALGECTIAELAADVPPVSSKSSTTHAAVLHTHA